MTNCTVQVSNVSCKATPQDIQDFFSYAGHVENVELRSDGESQVAYVTFTDSDSSDIATILSGSTIADQEINVSIVVDPSIQDTKDVPEAESTTSKESSKAEEMVTKMLSEGYILGKEVLSRAKSLDEKCKHRSESSSSSSLPSTTTTKEASSGSWAMGQISKTRLAERWNAGTQKVQKQVEALNERFQIGGRTMAAVAMAQRGFQEAIAKVRRNHGGDPPPVKTSHEQVQLTEMSILKDESRIHPLNNDP